MKRERILTDNWFLQEQGSRESMKIPSMPMQVHNILYHYGKISDSYQWGKTEDCRWVNDKTWIYSTDFRILWCSTDHASGEKVSGEYVLLLEGLDTFAEIRVNQELAGRHNDCYLPCRLDISALVRPGRNTLEIIFRPVGEVLKETEEKYKDVLAKGTVEPCRFLRKTFHDFTTYLGNDPDFYKVGVFGKSVLYEIPDKLRLEEMDVDYALNETLDTVKLQVYPVVAGEEDSIITDRVRVRILYGKERIWEQEKNAGEGFFTRIENVHLWWPAGYGTPDLYCVQADLIRDGQVIDTCQKQIGFRKITVQGMLDFQVNKKTVKLWGANLTPDQGYTLCEDTERIRRLLNLAKDAHVNTLRIWGEGTAFGEFLYNFADENGILLWQEFFCGHAQYPDVECVREKILQEAEHMIRSRKHHPSILLWCGGNECYLSRDFAAPQEKYLMADFFEYDLKRLCLRLDPDRYYHVNSPFFGSYSNEPGKGDTHSYTNSWYVPGSDHPIFASENLRVSFPGVKTLKRYLKKDTLPTPTVQRHGGLPWPKEYESITSAESWKKIPSIEAFYEAESPEEMVYQYGAAAGQYIKDTVERYRRGRKAEAGTEDRICKGHFIWKWNTTFPHIYSSVLDFYLEQKMPYYYLKRAYEPLSVQVEAADHLHVWLVNDTGVSAKGRITAELFDMQTNCYVKKEEFPVICKPGESAYVGRLDSFGQFTRDKIVKVTFFDTKGTVTAQNHTFVDIERHLAFPQSGLEIWKEKDEICLRAKRFARSVELCGEEDGDAYWWDFQDNFFDLFPGEVKRVGYGKTHRSGRITAKAVYDERYVELNV
ncbi:glycoside hydrolase family 2 protein [Blautia marasmi]|uniref:glycoside hydrolase family 2 protein n=1 Tax=Blautia marasmi TaxID=1917868 RepID=UPI00266D25DC|nr:glycoside hydrolase family 2 protein [Blautia marasmi]